MHTHAYTFRLVVRFARSSGPGRALEVGVVEDPAEPVAPQEERVLRHLHRVAVLRPRVLELEVDAVAAADEEAARDERPEGWLEAVPAEDAVITLWVQGPLIQLAMPLMDEESMLCFAMACLSSGQVVLRRCRRASSTISRAPRGSACC